MAADLIFSSSKNVLYVKSKRSPCFCAQCAETLKQLIKSHQVDDNNTHFLKALLMTDD